MEHVSLLYFNVDHVLEVIRRRARVQTGLRRVICDLSNVPYVDIAGTRMLRRLHEELAAVNVDLKIVEAHGPTRDILRAEGLGDLVGSISRYGGIAELIAESRADSSLLWPLSAREPKKPCQR